MISILEYASRMPALNMSRQASRDFDNVRVQVEALVANFNTSVMEVLGKYHHSNLEHCSAELTAAKSQLAEQQKEFQKELDYRNGIIMRLEKDRNDVIIQLEKEKKELKIELDHRIEEARKLARFERLDLRPSPTYHLQSHQVESEPETSNGSQSRDLESVISRLKNKQKQPRQVGRRRHTHDSRRDPGPSSLLAQAQQVPDLIPVVNVEVTERIIEVKQEYDVDDNDVDVLQKKEVAKPDTPTPQGEGYDIVDEATAASPGSSQAASANSPGTSQKDTDGTSETSQEPGQSDTSSDGERPTNNNDLTFVNRQSDQLSLPLKKRKPPPKKRSAKTPEPEKAKPKPRRVKALSSDSSSTASTSSSSSNQESRLTAESRTISAPSVAISEDEITPLPLDSSAKSLKRKRVSSLDTDSIDVRPPTPRRSTKTSRAARDETDSDMEDPEILINIKPAPVPVADPSEQILEIGVVHASNTPIMSDPKPKSKKDKPAKAKRSRSTSAKEKKKEDPAAISYDCTRCTETFTSKAELKAHAQTHGGKKRKISKPPPVENPATAEPAPCPEPEPEAAPLPEPEPETAPVEMETEEPETSNGDYVMKCEVAEEVSREVTATAEVNVAPEVPAEAPKTLATEVAPSDKGAKKRAKKERRKSKSKSRAKENVEQLVPAELSTNEQQVEQTAEPETPNTDSDHFVSEPLMGQDIKSEPTDRDTPSSMGRNTPSTFGRETPESLGRSTPTSRASSRRGYQGPLHRCSDCPATFKFKYCLDNHRGIHTQQHENKCPDCSATFRTMKGLKEHAVVHKITSALCQICHKAFEQREQLTAHMVIAHSDNPPSPKPEAKERQQKPLKPLFPCDYCTHVSETKADLAEHAQHHKNDRGWKCSYCPSTFRWKGSLDVHMARHEDEARPCGHCGMVLANKALLTAHVNAEHKLKFEVLTGAEAITQAMGDIYS